MDIELRRALVHAIRHEPAARHVVKEIVLHADGSGTVEYATGAVAVDPKAPGFTGPITKVTDEELVRAWLLVRLLSAYKYAPSAGLIEVEHVYAPVGRPTGKGGRVDVILRERGTGGTRRAFMFIEVKAPDKYDDDRKYIDGQLFRLSRMEPEAPRYLVYYTAERRGADLRDRVLLIDTSTYPDFDSWDAAGQPMIDSIPVNWGRPAKRLFANVEAPTTKVQPLDRAVTPKAFHALRNEIHDVIWGGGGTNNNEVFSTIVRLLLCKIYDEKETPPSSEYRFQRLGDEVEPEPALDLVARLNTLYREAEANYLAMQRPAEGPAFDVARISADKIAYVVGRLQSISVTENEHPGDLLGEFFEQIVAADFTQTKGQFFTPVKLVRFMLSLCDVVGTARRCMESERDQLGRPRLPNVLDPSCGSGTFLIEYMKEIGRGLGARDVARTLPARVREAHGIWFSGHLGNAWAREFLFGVENNYDLGVAAKVNMVLHGDGSMNTWITSGILPFTDYWVEGRHNVLGVELPRTGTHPYISPRNEQFDLILTNPPFSVELSKDEARKVRGSFSAMGESISEAIFIERWYQLLREGGRFCCILPEAIADTKSSESHRLFLLQHFRVEAVVSLPYDAFKPFTSTKTCIIMATKRTAAEVGRWRDEWNRAVKAKVKPGELAATVLRALGWADQRVFMAEPANIGYKRRKNLPDLELPNDLYSEGEERHPTVIDAYSKPSSADPKLGFWVTLGQVATRPGLRLDPKYRWLWDFQHGVGLHGPSPVPLANVLKRVSLDRCKKGSLPEEVMLVDLDAVAPRSGVVNDDVPVVDVLGSDRVRLGGAEIVFSKLEPYLGKVIVSPPDAVGSPEWVGFSRRKGAPDALVLGHLLMLPELCEVWRRLQSGKRHARLDPSEMLEVRVQVPSDPNAVRAEILRRTEKMASLRDQIRAERTSIDDVLRPSEPE